MAEHLAEKASTEYIEKRAAGQDGIVIVHEYGYKT